MKKNITLKFFLLFCVVTNAVKVHCANTSVDYRTYFQPMAHPLKSGKGCPKLVSYLAYYRALFRACQHADEKEKMIRLRIFLDECAQAGLNPNLFANDEMSPLMLACQKDKSGQLFRTLANYKIILEPEYVCNLIRTAFNFGNHTILKIMAEEKWLTWEELIFLASNDKLSLSDRYELFSYVIKELEKSKDEFQEDLYLAALKVACEIDIKAKKFDELMDLRKSDLNSNFIEELFQIALEKGNFRVIANLKKRFY